MYGWLLKQEIFKLWDVDRLTFAQIAAMEHVSSLSLKRIRNIVYAGPCKLTNELEHKIYRLFRLHFLDSEDIHSSILWVYENQPSYFLSENSIRRIINDVLNSKKVKL